MNFESLQLLTDLVRAVPAEGYTTPTPIQLQAIPHVLVCCPSRNLTVVSPRNGRGKGLDHVERTPSLFLAGAEARGSPPIPATARPFSATQENGLWALRASSWV